MNFVGIIAEYDPFHSGHALQLRMLRQRGASTIAVCMSTGVVQRGGVPILPEAVRVRAALAARGGPGGGAALRPMPTPAQNSLPLPGYICWPRWGAIPLRSVPRPRSPPPCRKWLPRCAVRRSRRRCAASWKAACPLPPPVPQPPKHWCPGAADLLQTPNNILGIEYCKAILRQGAAMQLLPLPRLGAAHGTAQTGQVQGQVLASASHIRQLVHTQGIKAASPFVPQAAMELYRQAAEQGQLADPEKVQHRSADFAAHQNAGAAEYFTRRGRRAGKPPVCRSPRSRNGK